MSCSDPKKLKSLLKDRSKEVDEQFKQLTFSGYCSNQGLTDIWEKTKLRWNEFTRPALISLCCEAAGGQPSETYDASLVVTTVAAGMAIHDDIIDKSKNKHFRNTILSFYDQEQALLIGDLLLIKGLFGTWDTLSKAYSQRLCQSILSVIQRFIFEVYDGEFIEVSCRKNLAISIDEYLKMIWKISGDVGACARIGAIISNTSEREIEILADFGSKLGFVTRLGEEVRDSMNREGNLSDRLRYESVPLPLLYAAKSSNNAYSEATTILKKSRVVPNDVRRVCWKARAVDFVYEIAKRNADDAIKELELLRPSSAKNTLGLLMKMPLLYIKKERDCEGLFHDGS